MKKKYLKTMIRTTLITVLIMNQNFIGNIEINTEKTIKIEVLNS